MTLYDCIVVGGGVNGSATAYSLTKRSKLTLLLEQFPVPHTLGSSHGQTRIIRCLYPEELYATMTTDSIPIWRLLEKECNAELFLNNGILEIFDGEHSEKLFKCVKTLNAVGASYTILKAREMMKKFPIFNVPEEFVGLYETRGGTLMANKCLLALQNQFVKNGGHFKDGEKVVEIIPGHDVVRVKTSKNEYTAKSLVITAGPYTTELTKSLGLSLPLRVERTFACYWKLQNPSNGSLTNGFPSFMCKCTGSLIYGLAAHEYPGLIKICEHRGSIINARNPDVEPDMKTVTNFIKTYTRGVEHKPTIVEGCMYTLTPDSNFILDTHPVYKNIAIGAGFSGSGFKMAPVTGDILADLAMGEEIAYNISELRMNRFDNIYNSKL